MLPSRLEKFPNGLSVGVDFSSRVCFPLFFRRLKMSHIKTAREMRKARPPRTPPSIAPIFELAPPLPDDGLLVAGVVAAAAFPELVTLEERVGVLLTLVVRLDVLVGSSVVVLRVVRVEELLDSVDEVAILSKDSVPHRSQEEEPGEASLH